MGQNVLKCFEMGLVFKVLYGVNKMTVDDRGRITIPKKYATFINCEVNDNCSDLKSIDVIQKNNPKNLKVGKTKTSLIVTVDMFNPCLNIYPLNKWKKFEAKIEQLPIFNNETEVLKRILISNISCVDLDTNHRLLIPEELRIKANLGVNPLLVGQISYFQLWNPDLWQQTAENDLKELQNSKKLREKLEGLNL